MSKRDADLLRKNFPIDYVAQMNPLELKLLFEGGMDYPEEWNELDSVKAGLEAYHDDPNVSFFRRKYKEMGKPYPDDVKES